MPKQSFGQLTVDMKNFIKSQKQKEIIEIRKIQLKKNLKKRKKLLNTTK